MDRFSETALRMLRAIALSPPARERLRSRGYSVTEARDAIRFGPTAASEPAEAAVRAVYKDKESADARP